MAVEVAKGTEAHGAAPLIEAGLVTGLGGGILFALWTMIVAAAAGMGFWAPMRWMAALFYGQAAMTGGGGVVLAGIVLHVIIALALGVLFAAIISRAPVAAGAAWGSAILYGIIVWAMMTFIVLPVADPVMRSGVAAMPLAWFAAHILYGIVLAYTPVLRRRYTSAQPV